MQLNCLTLIKRLDNALVIKKTVSSLQLMTCAFCGHVNTEFFLLPALAFHFHFKLKAQWFITSDRFIQNVLSFGLMKRKIRTSRTPIINICQLNIWHNVSKCTKLLLVIRSLSVSLLPARTIFWMWKYYSKIKSNGTHYVSYSNTTDWLLNGIYVTITHIKFSYLSIEKWNKLFCWRKKHFKDNVIGNILWTVTKSAQSRDTSVVFSIFICRFYFEFSCDKGISWSFDCNVSWVHQKLS